MKTAFFLIFSVLILCFLPGTVYSQETRVMFAENDLTGFYCGDAAPDNIDHAIISNDVGAYFLRIDQAKLKVAQVYAIAPDTPIRYDIRVEVRHIESNMYPDVYITRIEKTGDPVPGSCKTPKF
jgi:hypothetical protein